ncbi:uncharacterized protein LOC135837866 isoform X2 [Planococcus citri]|uniref:uncharacterized protein LOC135837063 isoform X2 n=1 Tax=Planococcus citri TaxID=170843 RepID=UPI0031F8C95F
MLKYTKLSSNAFTPTRGSEMSAGFDLYSAYDYEVPAAGRKLIKTDLQFLFPEGTYGRIAPRSGLALNHFITVGGGVIDPDYLGDIGVILFNHAHEKYMVKKGDRIAQIIIEKVMFPELTECDKIEMNTERGKNGFGSTDDSVGVGKKPNSVLEYIEDLSKKKKMDDEEQKKKDEKNISNVSTEVIVDFEGFNDEHGNFIIKEMSLAFLSNNDVLCFHIKSPCTFEELSLDKQIRILTKYSLTVWTMGEDKCKIFSKILKNDTVKNLKDVGCPDSDRLVYTSDLKSCFLHGHNLMYTQGIPNYDCAMMRVQKYRDWFWKTGLISSTLVKVRKQEPLFCCFLECIDRNEHTTEVDGVSCLKCLAYCFCHCNCKTYMFMK